MLPLPGLVGAFGSAALIVAGCFARMRRRVDEAVQAVRVISSR